MGFLDMLLGSIATLGGSGISAYQSNKNAKRNLQAQREANALNLQMNQENNEVLKYLTQQTNASNEAMAREANALTERLQVQAQDFNSNEAQKMREWNDPANMLKRSVLAGLNPSSVNNESVGGFASSPAASGISGSPAVTPDIKAGHVSPVIDNNNLDVAGEILGSLSGVLQSMSQASLESIDRNKQIVSAEKIAGMQDKTAKKIAHDKLVVDKQIADSTANLNQALADVGNQQVEKLKADTEYQKLVNGAFPARLQADLNLSDAQVFSLVRGVAAQFAAVNATMQQIKASLQMNHNNLAASWNQFGAQLETDINQFNKTLAIKSEELGLSKKEFELSLNKFNSEFNAEHGGMNKLWDWLGLKTIGGIANVFASFYAGKIAGGKGKLKIHDSYGNEYSPSDIMIGKDLYGKPVFLQGKGKR